MDSESIDYDDWDNTLESFLDLDDIVEEGNSSFEIEYENLMDRINTWCEMIKAQNSAAAITTCSKIILYINVYLTHVRISEILTEKLRERKKMRNGNRKWKKKHNATLNVAKCENDLNMSTQLIAAIKKEQPKMYESVKRHCVSCQELCKMKDELLVEIADLCRKYEGRDEIVQLHNKGELLRNNKGSRLIINGVNLFDPRAEKIIEFLADVSTFHNIKEIMIMPENEGNGKIIDATKLIRNQLCLLG